MKKEAISPEHRQLIDQAVDARFNSSWQLIELLSKGLSASTLYKIQADERSLVVRLSDPNHPHNNLGREYDALLKAANNGIAPQTYYADAHAGIAVMDFVEAQAPYTVRLFDPEPLAEFAWFIRRLHQGAEFREDDSLFKKLDIIFSRLPLPFQASEYVTKVLALKAKLEPHLSDAKDLRPSHCDINPFNLLWDEKQFWLVDWEAASQQGFYFDLACSANFFFFAHPQASELFLKAYLEREPSGQEKRKYALMQTFVAIYYGFMFVYMSSLRGSHLLLDTIISLLPDYPNFMNLIGQGKENLAQPLSQQKLGFVYLEKALSEGGTAV